MNDALPVNLHYFPVDTGGILPGILLATTSSLPPKKRGERPGAYRSLPGFGGNSDLWLVSADGTVLRQLTVYAGRRRKWSFASTLFA